MRRSLRAAFDALMAPFLHQDFDRVMQFLGNLGVIAALLASLLFGIVMTMGSSYRVDDASVERVSRSSA